MSGAARALRTARALVSDPDLRRLSADPRRVARWAAVWDPGSGRGAGPLRRAPRSSCAVCSAPAPLVVGSAYDSTGSPTCCLPACRRHADELAMAQLAGSPSLVATWPARRTWRAWWRSAPPAIAWRSAAARLPRPEPEHASLTGISAQVFRERPSLW
jgi:hypothetical protein